MGIFIRFILFDTLWLIDLWVTKELNKKKIADGVHTDESKKKNTEK